MAYYISEDCTACGACESECPNSAISQGDERFMINGDKCTECVGFHKAPACAGVCPVDACQTDPNRKETEGELIARLKTLYPGKQFATPIVSHFSA